MRMDASEGKTLKILKTYCFLSITCFLTSCMTIKLSDYIDDSHYTKTIDTKHMGFNYAFIGDDSLVVYFDRIFPDNSKSRIPFIFTSPTFRKYPNSKLLKKLEYKRDSNIIYQCYHYYDCTDDNIGKKQIKMTTSYERKFGFNTKGNENDPHFYLKRSIKYSKNENFSDTLTTIDASKVVNLANWTGNFKIDRKNLDTLLLKHNNKFINVSVNFDILWMRNLKIRYIRRVGKSILIEEFVFDVFSLPHGGNRSKEYLRIFYVFTVPLDIITSPFQIISFLSEPIEW